MGTIIAVIEGVGCLHYGFWFLVYVFGLRFCFCLCFLERKWCENIYIYKKWPLEKEHKLVKSEKIKVAALQKTEIVKPNDADVERFANRFIPNDTM